MTRASLERIAWHPAHIEVHGKQPSLPTSLYSTPTMDLLQPFLTTPPQRPIRPPKTKLPEVPLGKSPAAARHFIRQCTNYTSIWPFADPGQQIRWALQLLDGEAAPWRDKQLDLLDQVQELTGSSRRLGPFCRRVRCSVDRHEAEKALDKLMQGKITQTTSVTRYNDMFNQAL